MARPSPTVVGSPSAGPAAAHGAPHVAEGPAGRAPRDRVPAEEASTAELVGRVARWLHGRARDGLAPLGLTPAAGRAFMTVARCEPVRMADLAARLRVVPRSATTTVDLLEDAGLVERTQDPEDRRSVLVRLTDAGRARTAALGEARDRAARDLLAVLSAEEQERLHDLLARVDDAAQAARAAGCEGTDG